MNEFFISAIIWLLSMGILGGVGYGIAVMLNVENEMFGLLIGSAVATAILIIVGNKIWKRNKVNRRKELEEKYGKPKK